MNNSVGLPDIELLKRHSIKCIIGNDGMTADIASEWRNTLFALHHQTQSPVGCTVADIHNMIIESYACINHHLTSKLGAFTLGYESDLLALDYSPSTPMYEQNVLGHILYGIAHQFRPKYVWTYGVLRVKDYELNEAIYHEVIEKMEHCQEVARMFWNKL
jgi:cytosine/adenosine deaminase-related metal-dependent hydrolase